jgi:histidine triad (HIT) family protein
MECLFCKIVSGSIPVKLVGEGPGFMAFLDIHPRSSGHTLVIPKKHYENILDIPSREAGDFFQDVRAVVELLNRTIRPDGFTIGINHNLAAGQEVDHLHVHIIPRFKNDAGGSVQGVVSNQTGGSLDEVLEKIKSIK